MRLFLLLFFFTSTLTFAQGKLDTAKKDMSTSSSSSSSSSSSPRRPSSGNDDSDLGFFGELLYEMTLGVLIGDAEIRAMNRYPYYNGFGEYVWDGLQRSRVRLGGNYVLNKHVRSYELYANYRIIPLIGIDVSRYHFAEPVRGEKDFLNTTSIMLNYYRVREESISAWWGLGGTYVGNGVDTWGLTYSLGMELYVSKPVSFHASFKKAFINESKIDILKLQTKYHLKRSALFLGYQHNVLGSVTIGGLSMGIEYTF